MKRLIFILLVALGLQTQAQIMYCDSISYTTSSTINYPLVLSGSSSNVPGIVTWNWTVCNNTACYTDAGGNAHFGQVSTTDTLKVCYDATIDINGFVYVCTNCDSLIYNPNSYQWEILPRVTQPTVIKEIKLNTNRDGKIYDLLGKELNSIPKGKMYIRDNRLYIRK